MKTKVEICHIDSNRCVVRVSGFEGERDLGSSLGEAADAEEAEEAADEYIKNNIKKPVISYIAGQTAPEGKRMGHAGAIIAGGKGTAKDKIEKLNECGIHVAENLVSIGSKVAEVLGR